MSTVTRRRRVNIVDKKKVGTAIETLNTIAERMKEIMTAREKLDAEVTELGTEASGLMQFLKTDELKVPGCGTHTFKEGKTNAKNVVRPKEFRHAAGDNAFWAVCDVPIGKAKLHLGEKELEDVCDHTPGGVTPAVYKFKS
jgi:hypothetical protein